MRLEDEVLSLGLETSRAEPGSARSLSELGNEARLDIGSRACTLKYSTTIIIVISSNLKHNMFHIIKNYVPAL
jgi:hypothetical protein